MSVSIRSYLLASQAFLDRVGEDVLYRVYGDLRSTKERASELLSSASFSSDFGNEVKELWRKYLDLEFDSGKEA